MNLLENIVPPNSNLPEGNLSGLIIKDIRWSVKTAGPSPNNGERVELFLNGCKKAMLGYPCKGCFNKETWNTKGASTSHDPIKTARHIAKMTNNRYITIGGGEPLDQIDNLIILCKELKKLGFHIIVYSWRRIEYLLPSINTKKGELELKDELIVDKRKFKKLSKHIDVLIDGAYDENLRIWDGKSEESTLRSVGSSNQRVLVFDNNECSLINCVSIDKIKDIRILKVSDSSYLTLIDYI